MSDLGYISLLLAFAVSLYAVVSAILGARRSQPELLASSRHAVWAVCGLLTIATIALTYAFVTDDFRLEYVASYSSRSMSLFYTVTAFWAGNQGSLLFWSWTLSIFSAIVVFQNRRSNQEIMPYVIAVMMITQAFFVLLMGFVQGSNPFEKLTFAPSDGRGLNPLLENPGMAVHPPTQLLGYMGFTIPFAFAIAALITRRLGDEWLKSIRRWTIVAWLLLGLGNFFGAVWAYTVLGWGGYWGWDPVENAGIMPFLVGTAFLHSVMIQKRRGMLKVWNIVLIVITFVLSIFGTFLTRSGVLSSVHTFGQSSLGPFFLVFIVASLVGSTALLIFRLPYLKSEDQLDSFLSRESTFLLNNLILVGATFAIFLGTVFPVISEWVRGVKITVSAPFFNQVNAPIFALLILLMGICPLIGWRRATLSNFLRNFLYPVVAAIVIAVILFVFLGIKVWYAVLSFAVCGFVLSTILLEWFRGVRARHRTKGENYFRALFFLVWGNKPRYGGYIVHLGIILIAIGVIGSSAFEVAEEKNLSPGESMSIKGYVLEYKDIDLYAAEKRIVEIPTLSVYNAGKFVNTLPPQKSFHQSYQQWVSKVAIRTTPLEDLYVILQGTQVEPIMMRLLEQGYSPNEVVEIIQRGWEQGIVSKEVSVKVLVNPLVMWLWIGGGVLLLGAVIAFWPEKTRQILARGEEER